MRLHPAAGLALLFILGTGPAAAQGGAGDDEVIARINGEPVTESQFQHLLQQRTQGQPVQLDDEQRRQFLDEVVGFTLLAQDADARGLDEDPEVAAQLEAIRRAVLARAAVEQMASSDDITEEQIQSAYDEQYGDEGGAREYRARHILVEEEEKARELISELDGGADFAALAEEHSTGPTAGKGGELGWFTADQMVPAFAEATERMEKGSYSEEPVQTRFGWHVILLEDVRQATPPELEEVRGELLSRIAQERVQTYIEELREKAEVSYETEWAKPE